MEQFTNEQLCAMVRDGNDAAVNQLWIQCEKFIRAVAKEYISKCPEEKRDLLDDLCQESFIALADIAKKYDPDRGGKFLTYLKIALQTPFRSVMYSGTSRRNEMDPLNRASSLDIIIENEEGGSTPLAELLEDGSAQIAFEKLEEDSHNDAVRRYLRECISKARNESAKRLLLAMLDHNCSFRKAVAIVYGPEEAADKKIMQRMNARKHAAILQINQTVRHEAKDRLKRKYGIEQYADCGMRGYSLGSFREKGSKVERVVVEHGRA